MIIFSGHEHDYDTIECDRIPVIEDITKADRDQISLLIIREPYTHDSYVKLQIVRGSEPCTSIHLPLLHNIFTKDRLKIDELGRILLCDLPAEIFGNLFSRNKNKPATKAKYPFDVSCDFVSSYRCISWPKVAREWLLRKRMYGWPSKDTIQKFESFGCFVVKKGHPHSPDTDSEWRISFSLQERNLMFNLTDVQHKCYVVLKILNRDIIQLKHISSFHWKTCLFYVIEENDKNCWKNELLFHSVILCVKQMLSWVRCGFCPNYFIPGDNLFEGKLTASWRLLFENLLEEILDIGFDCFFYVESDKICDFVECRGNDDRSQILKAHSKNVYKKALISKNITVLISIHSTFNQMILPKYYNPAKENIYMFIKYLWLKLDQINNYESITNHTTEETKLSLNLLTPHIYILLACNISAMAIHHSNAQVRDFLLLGSFIYLYNGGILGRLKFISVLFALGFYKECELYIDQMDEKYIKNNPSFCFCKQPKNNDVHVAMNNIINTSHMNVSSCISFMPSELPIIPDAMKYELFRYVGIGLQEIERRDIHFRWNYRAVVDTNVYFLLLNFLIKSKLSGLSSFSFPLLTLISLSMDKHNVRHRDVAFNLLAWIYSQITTSTALQWLRNSWAIMNSSDLRFFFFTKEMNQKQYQFNSAKLHALVILYDTWFANKSCFVSFCFHCCRASFKNLQRCSRCKISTYCSKQCQRLNWQIHERVCKIVRNYNTVEMLYNRNVFLFPKFTGRNISRI